MKIGLLTRGGDCPGLNAVIRGAVLKGTTIHKQEFVGFRDGWRGVLEGDIMDLPRTRVRGLAREGGTILGTSRTHPYDAAGGGPENMKANLAELGVDAARTGGDHQFRRGIHAVDARTAQGQFGAEYAIATAQVEDALTGARVEQARYRTAEQRHEAGIDRIVLGVPLLASGAGRGGGVEGAHGGILRRWRKGERRCCCGRRPDAGAAGGWPHPARPARRLR